MNGGHHSVSTAPAVVPHPQDVLTMSPAAAGSHASPTAAAVSHENGAKEGLPAEPVQASAQALASASVSPTQPNDFGRQPMQQSLSHWQPQSDRSAAALDVGGDGTGANGALLDDLHLGGLVPMPGMDDAALWDLEPAPGGSSPTHFGADDGLTGHLDLPPDSH